MLNYFAHFRGELGYTVMSRELLKAMARERPDDVTAVPYDAPGPLPFEEEFLPVFRRTPDVREGNSLVISYGNDMYKAAGKKRVGYTMWETTKLPAGWTPCLNQMDEVWTMSQWGADIMADSGVTTPVAVVPGGVDELFNPFAEAIKEMRELPGFTFLSVFKWEKRKSPEMLLQAFQEEFSENEQVNLVLLAFNPFLFAPEQWQEAQFHLLYDAGIKKDERIHFLPYIPSRAQMPRIYCSADAFVLPSRGEGFGLPYIEAMACGLPTIGTAWSGNMEFMNSDNAYLIETEYMEAADMEPFIKKMDGSNWAYPSKDSLKLAMREVFSDPKKSKVKGLKASEFIHENFEWKHAAKKAWKRVDAL